MREHAKKNEHTLIIYAQDSRRLNTALKNSDEKSQTDQNGMWADAKK